MKNNYQYHVLVCICMVLLEITLIGAPTILRDNRVTDLATTPFLGRGYSIATNTFQSACMKDVQHTEPSYDLHYVFVESTDTTSTSSTVKTDTATESKSSYRISTSGRIFGLRGSGSGGRDTSLRASSKTSIFNSKTYYNHDVYAVIDLDTYYASVDESKSKLSDSAQKILMAKDLPGFFSSCGPYYVRSIGRNAIFVSKFTYSTEQEQRDTHFENELHTKIQGFATASASYRGWFASASASSSYSYENSVDFKQESTFNEMSKRMRLRIETNAFGLGKNQEATLISFDLESFRKALKDAFISMQNPMTGKVTTMEVVPWVENTDFQALVQLEKSDDVMEAVLDPAGKPVLDEKGNPKMNVKTRGRLLYEKKMILNLNAEFLMEIERVDRNLLNMFYKAKICRNILNAQFKKDGKEQEDIMQDFADRKIRNNRTEETRPLKDLDKLLTKEYIQGLLNYELDFMYGKDRAGKKDGSNACINQIIKEGIYEKRYNDIPECVTLMPMMGEIQDRTVEDYCMPTFAD